MADGAKPRIRIALHRTRSGYFAHCRDFPGCVCRGATEVEAIENVRASIRSYLQLARFLAADRPTVELEITP